MCAVIFILYYLRNNEPKIYAFQYKFNVYLNISTYVIESVNIELMHMKGGLFVVLVQPFIHFFISSNWIIFVSATRECLWMGIKFKKSLAHLKDVYYWNIVHVAQNVSI